MELRMMDALLIIVVAVAATYLTCFFNTYLKKGVVLASSLVTIIGGIGLPFLFPSDGLFLAGVAACGSYVAMISKERFNGRFDLLFLGIFVGILSSLSHQVFVGVGGRLGAIAAVSSISWL